LAALSASVAVLPFCLMVALTLLSAAFQVEPVREAAFVTGFFWFEPYR
jgi:hypothetical protein